MARGISTVQLAALVDIVLFQAELQSNVLNNYRPCNNYSLQ